MVSPHKRCYKDDLYESFYVILLHLTAHRLVRRGTCALRFIFQRSLCAQIAGGFMKVRLPLEVHG